ncbi:hypothetical protein LOZ12_000625 [Ophidiomyces ophidiicola]|uniref:Uncharacterized protein n=1 Tax=Ophidiomyces ophidiicola TaxID=1387563 RepID=A0ACB8V125_9EURO|nr:uncharacterized protein LOZ57_000068 [Ophidiomyces ophidiicola]KAI1922207.1 hypothetical protein LOZ64_001320 [Ophidiomyces ophidiicola]KAI1953727.1 hypothetical protein LOZ57_000068 [Ophidiomyces ophidiicola]KAI2011049.1 hypothetical protein LOZ50_000844 [Ophidiomyces ophidiicola]KAI2031330.1 hypothetical protein LOZ45_001393 [Ophidiomyces ophidiicola]KAI2041052.1 hypothetical protein LOZ47_000816 [Ophidiomyces ophidiicola]
MSPESSNHSGALSFANVAKINPPTDLAHQNMQPRDQNITLSTQPIRMASNIGHQDLQHRIKDAPKQIDELSRTVQELKLVREKEASCDTDNIQFKTHETTFDDDHLSNSSTKPTSFDSKSMASVTTFAMDEKESLRPDDSASVQALEEDELSVSGAPNSQVSSETGARLNHVCQLAMSQQLASMASVNISRLHDGESKGPLGETRMTTIDEPCLHGFPDEPDEKLLEAMRSPKDRLLILQLEEKIISFVKSPSEQSLELPPCNAFGRLLAHKLGDYYHLTHFVDNNVTSVRLHRTPWCRLPTSLSTLYAANAMKTLPPTVPTMKIMRRVGQQGTPISAGASTAPSSSAPSKTTSEAGADGSVEDPTESASATPAKDRQALTREEREAKYQEARERIFKDFSESKPLESPNSAEQSANVSRSNSRAGRKKNRQRTPHDDSFEARSQYSPYYAGIQYASSQMASNGSGHDPTIAQNNYMLGQPVGLGLSQTNQPGTFYPSFSSNPAFPNMSAGTMPQNTWQNVPISAHQYPNFYQGNQVPMMPQQQSSTRSSPGMNLHTLPAGLQYSQSPPWTQPLYQANYSSPAMQRNPQAGHWPNNVTTHNQVPYQYGQSQSQTYQHTPVSNTPPHPLPGSFMRSTFNPQSRSFAPSSTLSQSRYSDVAIGSSPNHNSYGTASSQWVASLHDNSNRFQNKNPGPQFHKPLNTTSSGQALNASRHDDNQNSIAKWGTPSHLPPKPPPSEIPFGFDNMSRASTVSSQNLSNNTPSPPKPATSKSNGPLVVGGSASQNSRSNGTWTASL